MTPVIVGVDGSRSGAAALELAVEEAAGRVAPLVVVHAADGTDGWSLVDAAVARVRSEHPAMSVSGELLAGPPAATLARRSRDAGLLVVGHRGRCGDPGHEVGSIAIRVAGLAEVPVIVHRPSIAPGAAAPKPVLVLVGAAPPDPLLDFAFESAARRDTPLVAILVGVSTASGDALDRWADKYPEVILRRLYRPGIDVAVLLTAASRFARLAVVGVSANGVGRLMAGSVGQALVHRAGCPVALVPGP